MNKNLLYKLQNDTREMEQRASRSLTDDDVSKIGERVRYILDIIRRMIFMQIDDLIEECKNVEQWRNLEMDLIRLTAKIDDHGSEQ